MGFRLKTILGIAAIEAVLLALLVISGLRWLQDSNQEQLVQRGAVSARLFATMTQDAVLTKDLATLDSFVREALNNPGVVYARVRDADGGILAEGGSPAALARTFSPDTDPSRIGDGVFDTFAPIKAAGVAFGRVELGLSTADFKAMVEEARVKASGIAVLEMALVGLFSLLLGNHLTQQLRRLRDASRQVADQGPGVHIPVRGRDELAQTIVAFNDMSARLAQANAAREQVLAELRRQIGERERAERALEEARQRAELASAAKSRFLATMSHEIRTPLNAIINTNDLLRETPLDGEQTGYVRLGREAGQNLLAIVNRVLDFSRIEAGQVAQQPEPCDPEELVANLASLLASSAFAKGLELTLFMDPRLPRSFTTDPGLLRQILLHLIGNAIKFTEQGGVQVRLLAEDPGSKGPRLRFEVIDTGIGIAEDRRAELFQEFSQLDNSHTRRYGGTGLGLAISRSLAGLLGGELGCDSRPGLGSRFWLSLPVGDLAAAPPPPGPGLKALLGSRVLLIQSRQPLLAQGVADQLGAWGLETRIGAAAPGAAPWLEEPGCAAVILLVDVAPGAPDRAVSQDSADTGASPADQGVTVGLAGTAPVADSSPRKPEASVTLSSPVIRLLRPGPLGSARGAAGPSPTLDDYLPLAPSTLARLLTQAAGPRLAATPPAAITPVQPEAARAQDRQARLPILLVDDSPANRLVAKAILAKAGYQADMAADGRQAVAAVRGKSYGLVLMDVAMPEMDGLEATRAIRQLPGDQGQVPIVALTAGAFTDDRRLCLEAGMNDYLSKPVVRADLLRVLGQWLPPPSPDAVAGDLASSPRDTKRDG
ncbi:MAG: response regulator [Chromatiaceae bacterium]|nr:response regulator [Chromatiaceae bacterium]